MPLHIVTLWCLINFHLKKIKYVKIVGLKRQQKNFFLKVWSTENQKKKKKKRFLISNEKYC